MSVDQPQSGLRARAARGVAWSTIDAVGSRLITTVVFIILARMLPPAAFGLVALSLAFVALTRLLVDQGFGAAIIQRDVLSKGHLDTAFWTSLVVGTGLAGMLYAAAAPAAAVLDTPDLTPVLRALSLVIVIGAPSSTAAAVLRRNLDFRGLAHRRLLAAAVGGVAGVSAAMLGLGVWALVVQALVTVAVSTTTLWVLTPYRPGTSVRWGHFRELFGFSNKVVGISLVNFASKHADDLLIGGVLGPTALGLYAVAYRLLTIMIEVLTSTITQVVFSAFSRIQNDLPRLRRAYGVVTRTGTAVAAPLFLLCAVLAEDVILTFFGSRWTESIPVMQALSLAGVAQAVATTSNAVLLSVGRAKQALQLSTLHAVVGVVAFVVAVPFGIQAVAIAFTVRAFVLVPVAVHLVVRALDVRWQRWVRDVAPPVVAATVMAAVVLIVRTWWGEDLLAPVRLVLFSAVAGLVYLGILRLLFRARLNEVLDTVTQSVPVLRRRRSAGSERREPSVPDDSSRSRAGAS